jgi:hypothetical protein
VVINYSRQPCYIKLIDRRNQCQQAICQIATILVMVWCYINKRIQSPKAVWYVAMIMSILKLIDKRIQSQKAVWYVAMIVDSKINR